MFDGLIVLNVGVGFVRGLVFVMVLYGIYFGVCLLWCCSVVLIW